MKQVAVFSLPKRLLKHLLFAMGRAIVWRPRPLVRNRGSQLHISFEFILSHYLLEHPNPFFIQVGANNGVDNDPLHRFVRHHQLPGVLIEPQRDAFLELKKNYSSIPGLIFKNVAIGSTRGTATLYRVKPGTQGPLWLHQIASLQKETILKHKAYIPGLEELIIAEEVECITFKDLFDELPVREADVLVIDAEGLDYELIKLFDVANRKPAIIHYEHAHLTRAAQDACLGLLIGLSYRIAICGPDTTAYQLPASSSF